MSAINTTLATLRSLTPDLDAILKRLGPLNPDELDPVVADYLDGYCPEWRFRAQFRVLACVCGQQLSRPVRITNDHSPPHDHANQSYNPDAVVASGSCIALKNVPPSGMIPHSNKGEAEGELYNPQDIRAYTCNDSGCCGYSGTPGNCTCIRCGRVVGTLHTDCCALHYFHSKPSWSVTTLGIAEATEDDQAIIDRLVSFDDDPDNTQALQYLWSLPIPLSPIVEATAAELFGDIGWFEIEKGSDHSLNMGWYHGDCEERGRWAHYRTHEHGVQIASLRFYTPGNTLGPEFYHHNPGKPGTLCWRACVDGAAYSTSIAQWNIHEGDIPRVIAHLDNPDHWRDLKTLRQWLETEMCIRTI